MQLTSNALDGNLHFPPSQHDNINIELLLEVDSKVVYLKAQIHFRIPEPQFDIPMALFI